VLSLKNFAIRGSQSDFFEAAWPPGPGKIGEIGIRRREGGSARSPIKERKPERGRSQGRGAKYERSAAKRALILDGSPSEGYNHQNLLQSGAPLYCVVSRAGEAYDAEVKGL